MGDPHNHTFLFRHEPLLGTVAEVGIEAGDEANAERIDGLIVDMVTALEATFSIFEPTSELSHYRRTGATSNAHLRTVLSLAERWRISSGGAFHPSMEPLRAVWAAAAAADIPPASAELALVCASMAGERSYEHTNLNAIAKGWIADRAVEAAMAGSDDQSAPISVWLSLGGDLVHRGRGSVQVGIEDPAKPFDNVAPLAAISLGNQALATSGNARRKLTIAARSYGHVLDPRTGMPVDHIASASVIAPDAATADVLATIAVVLTPDESLLIVQETVGASCLLIDADGTIITSPGWPDRNRG